nr:RNA-directed DNA polymerase, eukaryota [Tanacetum cinerariifolium]
MSKTYHSWEESRLEQKGEQQCILDLPCSCQIFDFLRDCLDYLKMFKSLGNTYAYLYCVRARSPLDLEETKVLEHIGSGTRWESLEDIANGIRFDMPGIKQKDTYRFFLWYRYKRSSRSERTSIVDEIREMFAYMAHLEKRLNMIGLLLFGPQIGTTIIRSSRRPGLPVVDDWECYKSMVGLFQKHYGSIRDYAMDHFLAFANICNNLDEKEAIEEAFKLTCSTKIRIPYDFNEVRNKTERFGSVFNSQGANAFNTFISSSGLAEVPFGGCSFTWCHKSATKMSKLDRFLISKSLMSSCPNISTISLDCFLSDHRPILLREFMLDYGPTPFRFFHYWIEVDGFVKVVEDTWKVASGDSPNAIFNLMNKLKFLKQKIQAWNFEWKNSSKSHSVSSKLELAYLDALIDNGEGVLVDGIWIENPSLVKTEFLNLFKSRFQKPSQDRLYINMEFPCKLSSTQQADLEIDVSNEEVKKAVWNCGIDKSPGPDGFTLGFYRHFWKLIEKDAVDAVKYFFKHGALPKVGEEKVNQVASKIGCLALKVPFSYLGTNARGIMSRIHSWKEIIDSMVVRLSKWKMKTLSIGGGLSVSSLYALNRAIMFKWVWRFTTQRSSLWARVIKAIHGDDGKIGNGEETVFWDEIWCDNEAFKYRYPRLYALETCKSIDVAAKFAHTSIDHSFRCCPRSGVEQTQLSDLRSKLAAVSLVDARDKWKWSLEGSGNFLVSSIRKLIDVKRLSDVSSKTRWIKVVPIKINILA